MNQIFGRKEIKNELQYGDYKAGKTIEAMQLLGIVVPVEGKGKGKYIFKNPK
jgi:ATP-dependent DNA helicase RecG